MERDKVAKKHYATPEMIIYGSVASITREASSGESLDAPVLAGMTFADATFS